LKFFFSRQLSAFSPILSYPSWFHERTLKAGPAPVGEIIMPPVA
jgi:hypothetical protein